MKGHSLLLALLPAVLVATAGFLASAQAPDKPKSRPLDVNPKHFSKDPSVKLDYDIVYVRAPRFVKGSDGKDRPAPVWPEIGHPYKLHTPTDLMLLHPDGSEEVLVEGGKGAIADPYVSFDAQWVYYSCFHDVRQGGADVYKVHVPTRKTVRLTQQHFTPNTGVADWSADFRTPEKGKTALRHGVFNMHPCPLPGGRVAFVSNRDGLKTPRGYPQQALQLFVMDDDGTNVEKIGHLNVACALHPVVLKDGRIIFSSLESQGQHYSIYWGIWSIHPDGTNWGPVVSALFGHSQDAFHFQTQLSDGSIVVEQYYNQNNAGFGTYYSLPPAPPESVPAFGSANPLRDPAMDNPLDHAPWILFRPYGMRALTPFTNGNDRAAPLSDPKDPTSPRVGKVTHPCGVPDNHLLTVWTPGGAPPVNDAHAGICLIKGGKPIGEPGDMLLIKHDQNYNAQWPRPLVPYRRIYGVEEPARLPALRNDGKLSKELPEGTPFGLVGTSSLYKRESFPRGVVTKGSVTATGNPMAAFNLRGNWISQGADAGLYQNSDIHAIRILTMEPPSIPVAGKFFNHARERLRILGEIPVRKFSRDPKGSEQPLDPDGNPDTSFLAKIPADVAWTFQTLDKDGMVLNMAQTWHQLRPGEVRNDCGGCHAHSQRPTLFKDTFAARPDYQVFDLTKSVPLLTAKKNDQSGKKWDVKDETGLRYGKGILNVEYHRDVKPILERSCVACHSGKSTKPGGNLVLDDDKLVGDTSFGGHVPDLVPATYRTLADTTGKTKHYVWPFQSRRSLLTWKVFGRRTDGLPEQPLPGAERDHQRILAEGDFTGSIMPPPAAVAGTYEGADGQKIRVTPLTDEDRRTIVRWIDLGCPLDKDYDPKDPEKRGFGWMLDDQRPTLTLTEPRAGVNGPLARLLVGMHDFDTGLDMDSFQVIADFPVNGVEPGQPLAAKFKPKTQGVWELQLAKPITDLPKGKLTVAVKDRQGNITRVERTFSVSAKQ